MSNNIGDIAGHDFSRTEDRCQGQSDVEKVWGTLQTQDVSTHQIEESCFIHKPNLGFLLQNNVGDMLQTQIIQHIGQGRSDTKQYATLRPQDLSTHEI